MENRIEERLPQVVEDRLQEAYSKILNGEVKQMKKKIHRYRRWSGVAAACAVLVIGSVGVLAAASYFQKEVRQEADGLVYEFDINYDLVPGEYEVTPAYLPEGYKDRGAGKYYGEDGLGITVMPIYTMAELDRLDGEINIETWNIENVEHTTLSGMEADVITFKESRKYETPTYVFLFNEAEGYVLHIVAQYPVGREDLLKFADSLTVKRTGDAAYETEEEKAARAREEAEQEQMAADAEKTWKKLMETGIPQDKIYGVGEELKLSDGSVGYTLLDYEFMDSIDGFDEENFFDFSRFDGWLNTDKTLKPYARMHYDKDMELQGEEQVEQRILRVELKAHCYQSDDVEMDFSLAGVDQRADGSCTWAWDEYMPVPEEHNDLHLDDSAVYFDQAVHVNGGERSHYFFRDMEEGEEITYTLLFVVDKDRQEDILLAPIGGNYSIWQTESETAEQILQELDGYIRLK